MQHDSDDSSVPANLDHFGIEPVILCVFDENIVHLPTHNCVEKWVYTVFWNAETIFCCLTL